MAEAIEMSQAHKPRVGAPKSKKRSTSIDLTPMVDLGFLLITFFIFTTKISQPTAMRLFLPKDSAETPVKASGALTLLLANNDVIFFYEGELLPDASNVHQSNFGEIREVIMNKKKSALAGDMMIIIKAQKECRYKNVVDALDEMTINDVKRYAMSDIQPAESRVVEEFLKQNSQNLQN